jgi:transcriptional regulator GlxA family with amidase domain
MSITFGFLVLPEIHLLDLAGPDQTVLEAIGFGADFRIRYAGLPQVKPVSSTGLQIQQLPSYQELNLQPGDFLVIPGSNVDYLLSGDFTQNKDLFGWLRSQHEAGVQLVSICAGAFVLGLAGLLDGRNCTTHFQRTSQLQAFFPKARVQENVLFIEQDGVYTSAGIASGIDLMLYLLEKQKGSYFTHKVARELVIYHRRDGQSRQTSALLEFRNHIHQGIHKVQDYLVEHLDQKQNLASLADLACMSERNLTRIFKKETGVTIHAYHRSIRIEKIRQLEAKPDLSRRQIAAAVGLESEKQLGRLRASTRPL